MGLSRRQFTTEFKLAAVRLLEAGGSLAEVAWRSTRTCCSVGGVSSVRRWQSVSQ
jgi:transposase-like protein